MDDKDDAKSFIRKFGEFDYSYWIQGNRLNRGISSRFVMHNKWVCNFSSHRKVENSKGNQKCDAFIDILIKIVTKESKKNDEYLKRPSSKHSMKQNISRVHTLPNYIVSLANGALNSRPWTIYIDFNIYKLYRHTRIHVVMDKADPWVVLVVIPLNERVQKLKNSFEIIFMGSTSSSDVSMASVTVLLTATKGGAVPIWVLIHKQQTAMAYKKGFKMLMDNFPLCFNGLTYPKIIMTRQFYHEDFQDVVNEINHLEGNQLFKDRFNKNLKRSQEWPMSYRNENLITRNNQTNNYSEATIRILKEIILEHTKAYNVVAKNQKDYELQLTKMKSVDPNSILQIDEFLYKVPSS
ncbi:hypothetical protein QTP88_011564 [Uroleucon formosanum]